MIIQLLGLIAIVIFTIFVSRTAKENGRNAFVWAVACVATGLGLQWVIPILVGIVFAIILIATGTPPERVQEAFGNWAVLLTIGSFVLSLLGMFLILRNVAQLQEEVTATIEVPPPPVFDRNDD